jgi:hypothetical protein
VRMPSPHPFIFLPPPTFHAVSNFTPFPRTALSLPPLLQVFSAKLMESINSIDGGFLTQVNIQELVLQTFSGKVGGG